MAAVWCQSDNSSMSEMPCEGKDKLPHSLIKDHTVTMYGSVVAQLPSLTWAPGGK